MKRILKSQLLTKILDLLFSPLSLAAAFWFKYCRMLPTKSMPLTEAIFMKAGILPVIDHYYQPLVNPKKHLKKSLREDRVLPGIEWNIEEQLAILKQFDYNDELLSVPRKKTSKLEFYYDNNSFLGGDAEYLYNIIRLKKPKKIIEIGCGYSTLMAQRAIKANKNLNPAYDCKHICIEPFEMPWLEQLNIVVVRKKVEDIELSFFKQLERNDILFIDSSHIIRPQGDVVFEFLEVLPDIGSGVTIHIHDIFSPKDYLDEWVFDHKLWNEQYLLEALLTDNKQFKIIGSLNMLKHNHFDALASKCPMLANNPTLEPGSFWIQRV